MNKIPRPGETFTIAGVYKPDQRRWKVWLHKLFRRPKPMTTELVRFRVQTLDNIDHA